MTEPKKPTMFCMTCERILDRVWDGSPGQPENALCFRGQAHYGSSYDGDHQMVGISFYEIFICDDCWPTVRSRALGVKELPARKPERIYFSGQALDRAFSRVRKGQWSALLSEE